MRNRTRESPRELNGSLFQLHRRGERAPDVSPRSRTRGGRGERSILAELFGRRDTVSLRRLIRQSESRGADSGIRHVGEYTALHREELVGIGIRRQGLPLHCDRQQSVR